MARELETNLAKSQGQVRVEFRTLAGRWLVGIGQIHRDAAGVPDWMTGLTADITGQRRAEEQGQRNEGRYQTLFDISEEAMLVVDQSRCRFIDANPAAVALYGYSREEWPALTLRQISAEPERSQAAVDQLHMRVPLRWHRRKSGELFPVEIRIQRFDWDGRPEYLAVVREIEDREGLRQPDGA